MITGSRNPQKCMLSEDDIFISASTKVWTHSSTQAYNSLGNDSLTLFVRKHCTGLLADSGRMTSYDLRPREGLSAILTLPSKGLSAVESVEGADTVRRAVWGLPRDFLRANPAEAAKLRDLFWRNKKNNPILDTRISVCSFVRSFVRSSRSDNSPCIRLGPATTTPAAATPVSRSG